MSGRESGGERSTDDRLTRQFTEKHGADLRFTAQWGRWHRWTGTTWKLDNTLEVFDLAREVCRNAAKDCWDDSERARIESAQTVSAVERLARSDRRHAATMEQWDSNPWLLGTPDGTVDLHTGNLRPAKPEDYITKVTAAAPGGDCPQWLHFLEQVTSGDVELTGYLQRMCGYGLTGVTREHALFFLYGHGANGKSVFLNVIAGLLGGYAKTAPIETFVESKGAQHPTDLAGLQGARLVVATETEDGRRWAESKLKSMTGGDRIAARYMRQDFFEFTPVFKLMIAGNHRPGLRSVDEAMRRRFNLLPFTITIPEPERDSRLAEKLRAEWPGILRWAVDGCLQWQRGGLQRPAVVSAATKDYLEAEDSVARWIEDRCEVSPELWTATSSLFADWQDWAESNHEFVGSQKGFSQNLEAHDFKLRRTKAARGFSGIRVTHVTDRTVIPVTRARERPIHNEVSHPSPGNVSGTEPTLREVWQQ